MTDGLREAIERVLVEEASLGYVKPPHVVAEKIESVVREFLASPLSRAASVTDDDLAAVRSWADAVLKQYKVFGDGSVQACTYNDALPARSVRSQMLTLVAEIERLRATPVRAEPSDASELELLREEAAAAQTCIGLLRWALRDAPEGQADYRPYVEYEAAVDARCPIPDELKSPRAVMTDPQETR